MIAPILAGLRLAWRFRGATLALVAALAVAFGAWRIDRRAYDRGYSAAGEAHRAAIAAAQARVAEASRLAAEREAQRLVAEAEAERLAQELEDAAMADPGAGRFSLPADSVRRLNRR